jgi:hypothetical protein
MLSNGPQQYRFRTINVLGRREQEAMIRNLGSDDIICTADEDLRTRLNELTSVSGRHNSFVN